MKQKNTTTPQHNREHNRAPCPTAPSAHASYKSYGCNNAKSPWPLYRNTMIDVVVLGCGPIRTARERRHRLLGCIFWTKFGRRRGLIPWPNRDGRTELDRLSWSKKSTIPQLTVGGLLMFSELAGGRNGGPVCGDENKGNIRRLGGCKAWLIGDQAVHFNGSHCSH